MEILIEDCFEHILQFCDEKEKFNLLSTCKTFREKYSLLLKKRMRSRLYEVFGIQTENFINALIEDGAAISGSLPLQCILNERYDICSIKDNIYHKCRDIESDGYDCRKSDIDIYVPILDKDSIEIYMNELWGGYPYTLDIELYKLREILVRLSNNSYKLGDGDVKISVGEHANGLCYAGFNGKRLHFIERFYINGVKVEVIQIKVSNRDEVIDFVEGFFDFDICKNLYFGDSFYINNIDCVLDKRCEFKYVTSKHYSKLRRKKYEKRGFEFF